MQCQEEAKEDEDKESKSDEQQLKERSSSDNEDNSMAIEHGELVHFNSRGFETQSALWEIRDELNLHSRIEESFC